METITLLSHRRPDMACREFKNDQVHNGDLIGTTNPMTLDITTAVSPKYQWPCGGNESYVAAYGRYYT